MAQTSQASFSIGVSFLNFSSCGKLEGGMLDLGK